MSAVARRLAGRPVNAIGLGCMGMSEFYGPTDEAEALATLHAAVEAGVTHFDTADTYGLGHNEALLGRFLRELPPSRRAPLTVATKFGIARTAGRTERRIDNTPAYIRAACEASRQRLGVDRIDLYYCHRRDPAVPLAQMMDTLAELVHAGQVAALGLSEVGAATLRAAHAVHPIAAVQSEYSLWAREVEAELLAATAELGVALVAYSPLGRAFLTDAPPELAQLDATDFRRTQPRFTGAAAAHNAALRRELAALAAEAGLPVATLALAWLLARGPQVLAIPGMRRRPHLAQNLAAQQVALPAGLVARLDTLFAPGAAAGARYAEGGWLGIERTAG